MGLQTPGEVVDANFGQEPFMFDIEDMMRELRARTRLTIQEFPVPESQGEWQAILHKQVSHFMGEKQCFFFTSSMFVTNRSKFKVVP